MQKFIITSSERFRFGDVRLHKDLLQPGEECIGGGVYEFDYVNGRMLLSGRSYDYGRPRWDFILGSLKLPASLRGLTLTYDDLPLIDLLPLPPTYE